MIVVGIDPGPTTGFAWHRDGKAQERYELKETDYASPRDHWSATTKAIQRVTSYRRNGEEFVVVVEDFQGIMHASEGVRTIKQLGYVTGACEALDIQVEIAAPQMRKACESFANDQISGTTHELAALSHALCWYERNKEG